MSGSSQGNAAGVYGQLGIPAPGSTPGGRWSTINWVDTKGNLWLFGAQNGGRDVNGIMAYIDDVWEYNPSTQEWTWMAGSDSVPAGSSNGCITCAALPVFGNYQTPAAGNTPGGRTASASWIDSSGNLWLFGGEGLDSSGTTGYLNDLWMFNPSSNQWTWMGGSNTFSGACLTVNDACAAPGVFVTLQTLAAGNTPMGRSGAATWTDARGNFWLFGGTTSVSYDINGNSGFEGTYINDLWEFDTSAHEWAWMGGTATLSGNAPQYGNTPGGRSGSYTWTDNVLTREGQVGRKKQFLSIPYGMKMTVSPSGFHMQGRSDRP